MLSGRAVDSVVGRCTMCYGGVLCVRACTVC